MNFLYCVLQVSITAFEADDVILRPWINATLRACFVLNTPPTLTGETRYVFNVQDMASSEGITLTSDDAENQIIDYSIVGR